MKSSRQLIMQTGRLNTEAAFASLRAPEYRWVSKGFALHACRVSPSQTQSKLEFCVIASKKTAKRAVDRNRMRRQLRALCWETLPRFAHKDYRYMVVARRDLPQINYETLARDFLWCLKKLGLLECHDLPAKEP